MLQLSTQKFIMHVVAISNDVELIYPRQPT